jgi:hypothetical protein
MAESDDEEVFIMNRGQGDDIRELPKSSSDDERSILSGEDVPRLFRRRPARQRSTVSMKPEVYNGDGDWEVYLNHFELCAELGNWGPREKVLTLAASLRGQAQFFYVTISKEERGSYLGLTHKLGQRFGRARQQPMWMSRLESRKRSPEESVANLADDLKCMTQRAYPGLDHQAHEMLALNQLYKSISPELKFKCISIVDGGARRKASIYMVENVPEQQAKVDKSSQPLEKAVQDLQECVRKLMMGQSTNNKPPYSNARSGPRLCYNCQSPQHMIRDCPTRQRPAYNSQRSMGYQAPQRMGYPAPHQAPYTQPTVVGLPENGRPSTQ